MDRERADYADNDLPPPRRWPWSAATLALGIGLFMGILGGCLLLAILAGPYLG